MALARLVIIEFESGGAKTLAGIVYDDVTLVVSQFWARGTARNDRVVSAHETTEKRREATITDDKEKTRDASLLRWQLQRDNEGALILPGVCFGHSR
jgi:hypothetical protein